MSAFRSAFRSPFGSVFRGPFADPAGSDLRAQVISALYGSGEQGALYDPSDLSTLYQDSAGTTPVTADGDPVGRMEDLSGNGNHFTQTTTSAKPIYKTDGTLHWLQFDGFDDALSSAAIDFSATDKMTIFAGLRKADTSSNGMLMELSASVSSNTGSFYYYIPGASLRFNVRGTGASTADWQNSTAFGSVADRVLSAVFDITEADYTSEITARSQGSALSPTSGAGSTTGTFGNHALYFCARGGSSLPFNGRVYGMAISGAEASSATIDLAESLQAIKSGVTL